MGSSSTLSGAVVGLEGITPDRPEKSTAAPLHRM